MYLKYLDIHGFKSFADPVRIEFKEGITVIVGPNGCGKTNIVEAILWVLGEKALSNLRSSSSTDLIFSGSKTRSPLGMAEVSITFDNTKRIFDIDADEVKVTRKLFRDGSGEFLINGENARLKDIKRLFLDTGLGVSTYSILKQGVVEKIIHSKPEDLRVFVDEAIGVSKYQFQKKEAERNIEKSLEDLNRVEDILHEVKKQLSSMEYQARKAKKYNELVDKYKNLKINFLLRKYDELNKKLKEKNKEWKKSEEEWVSLKES
ncbi:MAG: chromosome segregation protein SMC, partial [Caldiserica bacterium]